jgi:hypothetical protein
MHTVYTEQTFFLIQFYGSNGVQLNDIFISCSLIISDIEFKRYVLIGYL